MGIYGIRVLRADGNGAFSDLVRTYDHLLRNGRSLGIRVVNLSLSGSGTADDVECQYISQLIALGMTVVTAAGRRRRRWAAATQCCGNDAAAASPLMFASVPALQNTRLSVLEQLQNLDGYMLALSWVARCAYEAASYPLIKCAAQATLAYPCARRCRQHAQARWW